MEYKPRRKLTREFKLEAVRQVALSEKPKAQLARQLGVRVGQLRDWRPAVREGGGDRHRQAGSIRSRRPHQTRRLTALPLSRLERVGKLACAIGYAVVRAVGIGRVGNRAHGATLCASQRRVFSAVRGAYGRTFGHVLGTAARGRQPKAAQEGGYMPLFPQQKSGGQGRN